MLMVQKTGLNEVLTLCCDLDYTNPVFSQDSTDDDDRGRGKNNALG